MVNPTPLITMTLVIMRSGVCDWNDADIEEG